MKGFVSLVGAGPGDPGLITGAGRAAPPLGADVIVHDRLVNKALLDSAKQDAGVG